MKFLSIILSIIIIGCHGGDSKSEIHNQTYLDTTSPKPCNINYDSLLIRYGNDFEAEKIDLNKCLSQEVRSFILKADTNCLEKQKEYKNFITVILAKLYIHHLQCCNQGYDLLSMKEGAASIVINAFEKLAGYNGQNLEMLNSGIIVDYIDKEPSFKINKIVQLLRKNIEKEVIRIAKGNL